MELEKWNEDDQAGNLDDMQPSTSFPDKIGHPPTFGVSADRLKPQPPAITASLPSSNRNSLQMMGSTAIAPPPDPPSSSLTVSFNENAMETETKPTESFKRTRSDVLFMKPSVSFEPPRSLFEEKMQNQAIKLEQKAASKSSLYDPDNRLRRPSGESLSL
jgi:hypothetical protein